MMSVQPTAPSYSGEVTITLGGQALSLRFGLNTLRDYTALTGTPAGGLASDLVKDYAITLLNLVFVAVKRYTPAAQLPEAFTVDVVADWIEEMSAEDAERLAAVIIRSIKVQNPLVTALVAQLTPSAPEPMATDGTTSSTSPSASLA
jgi:hypothetical protein